MKTFENDLCLGMLLDCYIKNDDYGVIWTMIKQIMLLAFTKP